MKKLLTLSLLISFIFLYGCSTSNKLSADQITKKQQECLSYKDNIEQNFNNILLLLKRLQLSDCILLITFFAILWYSIETHGMRIQMKLQNKLTIQKNRPRLKTYINNNKLIINNIGEEDAFNIKITFENKIKKEQISPYHMLGIGKQIEQKMEIYKDWVWISIIVEYEHLIEGIKPYWTQIKLVNLGDGVFQEQPIILPQ